MFGSFMKKPSISAAEAVELHRAGKITLVDIREPSEILASGKARGAISLPLAALKMRADPNSPDCPSELTCGKPVVLYCASGGRAAMAAQFLGQMGYNDIHNIGGMAHWQQAGGEIE